MVDSSVSAKVGIGFGVLAFALMLASVIIVDWTYARLGQTEQRIGLWQIHDITANTFFSVPPGTPTTRVEAGRGCMVAATALSLFGVVAGIAYFFLKDPWAPIKRYVIILATLLHAFSALLAVVAPALIYDPANYPTSEYDTWSISTGGILAMVAIGLAAVATLLYALEWRWHDRNFGYNLLNTDPELLQDLRDYWQSKGRWEERQVIDEDWAIYRYLQQRRRHQNARLKRHIKDERRRIREREARRANQQPTTPARRFSPRRRGNDSLNDDGALTPPGFYSNASNTVHPA